MNLTNANVRYLLGIYNISKKDKDISSAEISRLLGITRTSVTRMA